MFIRYFCVISLVIFILPAILFAQDWNISSIWDGYNLIESDMTYDSQGNPHIVFIDDYTSGSDPIYYGKWGDMGWQVELITRDTYMNECSIAIDQYDRPHIAYNRGGQNYYARKIDTNWQLISVTSASGRHPSIITSGDTTHIITTSSHRYRDPESGNWYGVNVDIEFGEDRDIVKDDAGNFYLAHIKDSGVYFSYYDQSQWGTILVDGLGISIDHGVSIALDANNMPHITYYDDTNDQLKHAVLAPEAE